ncbi:MULTISPECIES: DUF5629 family protein [Pseudomonas]|uniref:DUF5629 family protein n=1 Tax=Pseudomonas donghuensis TaxID=1163398 RepID=A0AAP0XC34_9PSED|nr:MULTISPECIES: DUF5629 family protein [Pseudomonas]MDF9894577.1 hypothetical protein [Pseudomonas vranovensis]KDN98107.1 DUF5629 family protein [Pseudomonas donghuensis]MBF4210076.1 hypothetical protein [Pseudomonas donghuensis]MBS7597045.1 DUF5629 family protein [Pseudomonas sp. RC2C2]MCP6694044.1 DUF5629 family protein [Pseudomonas donghuensis]
MTTLSQALESSNMLLIDGLHAFDFTFDETGLSIELMDGRALKKYKFSPEQIGAARLEGTDWLVAAETGEHRLVCMSAFSACDEEDDDAPAEEPADRQ